MIPKCIKNKQEHKELDNNVKDLQKKYNSFIKPLILYFGSSSQLTKKFDLVERGSAFISIMVNGHLDGEAYIIYFNNKNTLTKVHQILGSNTTLTFSIENGVLSITSSVEYTRGFIIFNT